MILADPCTTVRQRTGGELLVCTVEEITDSLAELLASRPNRDELQLLFTTTEPRYLATVAKVPWVRSVLIYPGRDENGPVADLRKLQPLRQLRKLNVRNTLVREVEDAWAFPELTELSAQEEGTVDLTGAAALHHLADLSVGPVIEDLRPLGRLTSLEALSLPGTQTELRPLVYLARLSSLSLAVTEHTSLAPLAGLTALEELSISGASLPALVVATEKLQRFTRLFLNGVQQRVETAPLARLTRLELIDFGELPVADLTPLKKLPALKDLMLWNGAVKDLKVLLSFPALGHVLLPKDTPEAMRAELKQQRPAWF